MIAKWMTSINITKAKLNKIMHFIYETVIDISLFQWRLYESNVQVQVASISLSWIQSNLIFNGPPFPKITIDKVQNIKLFSIGISPTDFPG